MNDQIANTIKSVYSAYHAGDISADEALATLESAFAEME